MKRLLLAYAAFPAAARAVTPVACMATLWWLSSRPPAVGDQGAWSSFWHNGAHVVAYGSLAAAWLLLFHRLPGWLRSHQPLAIVLASLYGVVDELHQSYVPGRICSVADILTDAVGAWLGTTLVLAIAAGCGRARTRLPWLVLASLGSVAFATWGPW